MGEKMPFSQMYEAVQIAVVENLSDRQISKVQDPTHLSIFKDKSFRISGCFEERATKQGPDGVIDRRSSDSRRLAVRELDQLAAQRPESYRRHGFGGEAHRQSEDCLAERVETRKLATRRHLHHDAVV